MKNARARKRRRERLIVGAALVACAAGLWLANRDWGGGGGAAPANSRPPEVVPLDASETRTAASDPAAAAEIDDDGESMWVSPTTGPPLTWEYLPPGVQVLLALRPRELLAHDEGEKVLGALGPAAADAARTVEAVCGVPLREIERMTVGWQMVDGRLSPTIVAVCPSRDDNTPKYGGWSYLPQHLQAAGPNNAGQGRGQTGQRKLVVAGSAEAIAEVESLAGREPPLRREIETLVAHTDASRQATLIVLPGAFFGEGRTLFRGPWARLGAALHWFLGDETAAVAFSLHWDENFFAEAVTTPTLDVPSPASAQRMSDRIAAAPSLVEDYVLALDVSPYARRAVFRLPEMLRKWAAHARVGYGRDYVLARSYLPAAAGQNLALATELALMEGGGATASSGLTHVNETKSPRVAAGAETDSVRDRLRRTVTFKMPRDSLESALAQLADELGMLITIQGVDLQADGITKNQSLELDMENRSGEEILVEILRRANPDKATAGPADPRQKLVYVIRASGPPGGEAIVVTTRSRAKERGETLPAVFE